MAYDKKEIRERMDSAQEELLSRLATAKDDTEFKDTLSKIAQMSYLYSWGNTMAISRACPQASIVMGFKRWLKYERCVKKGEKGISILVPHFRKLKIKTAKQALTHKLEIGDTHKYTTFGVGYVFDVSQTEGKLLPRIKYRVEGGDSDKLYKELIPMAESFGYNVEITPDADLGRAYGDCAYALKRIRVSDAAPQKCVTLAHEIAHAILHDSIIISNIQIPREIKELEAEAVAFCVNRHFGIDTKSEFYLAAWGANPASVKQSLTRITKTARQIVEFLECPDTGTQEATTDQATAA